MLAVLEVVLMYPQHCYQLLKVTAELANAINDIQKRLVTEGTNGTLFYKSTPSPHTHRRSQLFWHQ